MRSTEEQLISVSREIGSIAGSIQWAEYVDDTNLRDVSMYVVRSEQVGVAPGVYAKLYCLPMQAFLTA